ncbi:LuxR family transcriptional regulator [Achromobacter sp. RTa]|uniref:response regulator n=1 Tax=Achromobacter sp. RTa TaxID=1532557 RepID=UPI00050EE4F4|nr:response regulator [Achromobacter sp. RTa]KGD93468.1 LuxR family transcriptional regulator [Achromobacter sp. RTa]
MDKLRIVLADDHPLVLVGIRDLLDTVLYVEVTGAVSSSTDLISHLEKNHSNVVITDYSMPGDDAYGDGMRLIKYLIRRHPDLQIVVLTMVSNPMIISALYDAGVAAVVLKRDNLAEIVTALSMLRLGRKYYPPGFGRDHLAGVQRNPIGDCINSLSPKEFEVLRHFVRGETVTLIAENLKRSVKTISGQKASAMRKLNVQTDQELVAFCMESGLFQ